MWTGSICVNKTSQNTIQTNSIWEYFVNSKFKLLLWIRNLCKSPPKPRRYSIHDWSIQQASVSIYNNYRCRLFSDAAVCDPRIYRLWLGPVTIFESCAHSERCSARYVRPMSTMLHDCPSKNKPDTIRTC